MAFNSLQFLVFFPIVVAAYFLLPHRLRWLWLLLASIYFYGLSKPLVVLQLAITIGATFYLALRIEGISEKPKKKRLMKLGVLALVANLFVFKYTAFVNESFRSLFEWVGAGYPLPVVEILLPLGISFYTFQLIGYLVDVSNGAKAERHLGIFALFVSFFPKVVAGPIERGKTLLPQLHAPQSFDYQRVASGLMLMVWGGFKKVVVADRLAPFVREVYSEPQSYDGVAMTLATWMFAFQVYCDFSGYTDIALGAAKTLGFKLTDNFNRPYFAISIQDFWKRWHISLTSWLTDYVYTPLTRSRSLKLKLYYLILVSLFTTFVVSGLWHGAEWTFVAWGALHGFYLIVAVMTQKSRQKIARLLRLERVPNLHRRFRIAVTFGLVCFAYILFQASSMADAFYIMTHLHTGWGHAGGSVKEFMAGRWAELLLACYGIIVVMAVEVLQSRGKVGDMLAARPAWVRWSVYYAGVISILVLGAFYDVDQQFIYFQF